MKNKLIELLNKTIDILNTIINTAIRIFYFPAFIFIVIVMIGEVFKRFKNDENEIVFSREVVFKILEEKKEFIDYYKHHIVIIFWFLILYFIIF